MEIIILPIVAFSAAILTFFSGFGLGTLLTPVFFLYFPVQQAIAMTAIVHFCNNIFKLILVAKGADWQVVVIFGLPAIAAAWFGAHVLTTFPNETPLLSYQLFNTSFDIFPVKLIIAFLLFVFALIDLIPQLNSISFSRKWLPLGGLLSGFFGGLSGNQGALRSAFLIKAGLSKEAFIGSAVIISTMIDCSRMTVYAADILQHNLFDRIDVIVVSVLAATLGAFIGNRLLKKVTILFLQRFVASLLIFLSIALGLGWL